MSVKVTGTAVLPPTAPPNVGTCCCEQPACTGTATCYREFASSESGWRRIADRRPNWVLANGQAV